MSGNNSRKTSSDISNTQQLNVTHISKDVKTKNSNHNSKTKTTSKVKNKSKKKKKNPVKRFFKTLLYTLIGIFCIYSVISLYLISKVDTIHFDDRFTNTQEALHSMTIKNVLLIGADGRSENDTGRSDSMVLLSIDTINRKLTLTSFMRDMYVSIPNYGYSKLNSAYSHGGAGILLDTIEDTFSIRIDDCIIIDFQSFMSIIDAIDGIDATISDSELEEINKVLMSEGNKIAGDDKMDGLLTSSGKVKLNGKQALTYSRIRYVGNADFERTERQRYVISAIVDRLKTPNVFRIFNFANTTVSEITTSLDTIDLYELSLIAPFMLGYDIVQQRVPADDTWYYDEVDGQSIIRVDFQANNQYLYDTIYSR